MDPLVPQDSPAQRDKEDYPATSGRKVRKVSQVWMVPPGLSAVPVFLGRKVTAAYPVSPAP